MNCKFCGEQISDDAVFCRNCGKRADGNMSCSSCGAVIPEGSQFCEKCGAELQSSVSVVKDNAVASADGRGATVNTDKNFNWEKAEGIIGVILVLVGALVAFCFTFGIGVTGTVGSDTISTAYIYDYFGEVYKNVNRGLNNSYPYYSEVMDTVNVFGTIIAAVGLLSVIVSFVITVYCSLKKWIFHDETNIVKPAVITYLCYVAFAVMFVGYHCASMDVNVLSDGYSVVETSCGVLTIVGLVLSSVCFVGFFALRVVKQIKVGMDKKSLTILVTDLLILILAFVVLILVSCSAVGVVLRGTGGYVKSNVNMSFSVLMTCVMGWFGDRNETVNQLNQAAASGIAFSILLVISISVTTCRLIFLTDVDNKNNFLETTFGSILPLLSAIAYLICSIVASNKFIDIIGSLPDGVVFENSSGISIAILIICAVICFGLILKYSLRKRDTEKEIDL